MTAQRARWSRRANCTLIARKINNDPGKIKAQAGQPSLTWAFAWERVTGIEPALSAWEADVLPLNYTRAALGRCGRQASVRPDIVPDGPRWIDRLPGRPYSSFCSS
jgi:hypothetical protein